MKRTLIMLVSGVALTLATASTAGAQMQWTDQAFVSVNLGAQAPSQSLTTRTTPDIYNEPASFETTQDVGGGAFFDIAGGYKVWRNLAVGHRHHARREQDRSRGQRQHSRPAVLRSAALGHDHRARRQPLADRDQPDRTWVMPITDKIDIGYQFGPTIFLVSQDLPGRADDQRARPGRSPRCRSRARTRRRWACTSASTSPTW